MANPERCIAIFKGEFATVEIFKSFEDNEYKLLSKMNDKLVFEPKFHYLKSTAYQEAAKLLIKMEIKNGSK